MVEDFITFRRMVTPVLIQVAFWIGVVITVIGGLAMLIAGDGVQVRVSGFIMLVFGPILSRLYAEIFIVVFRMNETLTEIKNNQENR